MSPIRWCRYISSPPPSPSPSPSSVLLSTKADVETWDNILSLTRHVLFKSDARLDYDALSFEVNRRDTAAPRRDATVVAVPDASPSPAPASVSVPASTSASASVSPRASVSTPIPVPGSGAESVYYTAPSTPSEPSEPSQLTIRIVDSAADVTAPQPDQAKEQSQDSQENRADEQATAGTVTEQPPTSTDTTQPSRQTRLHNPRTHSSQDQPVNIHRLADTRAQLWRSILCNPTPEIPSCCLPTPTSTSARTRLVPAVVASLRQALWRDDVRDETVAGLPSIKHNNNNNENGENDNSSRTSPGDAHITAILDTIVDPANESSFGTQPERLNLVRAILGIRAIRRRTPFPVVSSIEDATRLICAVDERSFTYSADTPELRLPSIYTVMAGVADLAESGTDSSKHNQYGGVLNILAVYLVAIPDTVDNLERFVDVYGRRDVVFSLLSKWAGGKLGGGLNPVLGFLSRYSFLRIKQTMRVRRVSRGAYLPDCVDLGVIRFYRKGWLNARRDIYQAAPKVDEKSVEKSTKEPAEESTEKPTEKPVKRKRIRLRKKRKEN